MTHVQARGGRPDLEPRRRRRGDDGVALVEFAIIAPLIFCLLLGLFTGGIALSRKNSMTNAVREGARLGATVQESASWATSVRDRVVQLSGGDLTNAQVCVQLVRKTTAASETVRQSTPDPCPFAGAPLSTNIPVGECVVKVWARRTSDLEVVFFSRTLTLTASSVNRYEREGIGSPTCA